MLKNSILDKLRYFIKRIPYAERIYSIFNVIFFPKLCQDGLITNHNPLFMEDDKYLRSYKVAELQLKKNTFYPLNWRAHTLMWAGNHAMQLNEGSFVECGVSRAFMSSGVINYIDLKNHGDRSFYLFDTFSGLVEQQLIAEDAAAHKNHYEDTYDFVVKTFSDFDNVHVIKGVVPESLSYVNIDKVCYLHIDMNCVLPEKAALEYFWPKLVKSGVVILDDYGFKGHEAQARAADDFAKENNITVLCLPTGQGMMIKP